MGVNSASIKKDDKEIEEMKERLIGLNSITGVIQYSRGETGKAVDTVYAISKRCKSK
jgi:hypothetical protein